MKLSDLLEAVKDLPPDDTDIVIQVAGIETVSNGKPIKTTFVGQALSWKIIMGPKSAPDKFRLVLQTFSKGVKT